MSKTVKEKKKKTWDDVLNDFLLNWSKRVREGKVSSLSGIELATLEIFCDFIKARYVVQKRGAKNEQEV